MLAAAGGKDDKAFYSTLDNFKQSFSTYMENYVPSLILSIKSGGGIAKAIAEAITDLPTQLLSDLGSAMLTSGTDVVTGVSKVTNWLIESITNMFRDASANPEQIKEFGAAIGDFLGSAISDIITNAPDILKGIIDVGVNLAGGLVEGLFKGLFGEGAQVEEVIDQMNQTIDDAEYKATKSSAIVSYLKSLADAYGDDATKFDAWKSAVAELQELAPETKEIFETAGGNVDILTSSLDQLIAKMRETAIQAGLMKALQDAYALLGEQSAEYSRERQRYTRNANYQDTYRKNVIDAIQSYAGEEAQKLWNSSHDEKGNVTNPFWSDSWYNDLINYSEGIAEFEDGIKNLSDLDFSQLESIANILNNENVTDILDRNRKLYVEAGNEMADAKTKMDAIAKEIESTNQFITDAEAAAKDAAANLGTSFDSTAAGIDAGGAAVAAAFAAAAASIGPAGAPDNCHTPYVAATYRNPATAHEKPHAAGSAALGRSRRGRLATP